MGAKQVMFHGAIKALDEWYEGAVDHYTSMMVVDDESAFTCCMEVAQDIGAWRHKVSSLLGMGLLEEEQYEQLMRYCDGLMAEAGEYLYDLEEGRKKDADQQEIDACY